MIFKIVVVALILYACFELRQIRNAVRFDDARITNLEAAKP
jgi:hypothetical protein